MKKVINASKMAASARMAKNAESIAKAAVLL